jgi:hypothetical protein
VLLAVSSALDPEAFCRRVAGVLPSGAGVDLVFRGIVEELNRLSSQRDWKGFKCEVRMWIGSPMIE